MSEAKLKETPPMVLARWMTAAFRDNSTSRKLAEVMADMEAASSPVTEKVFKPQKVKIKRGSTSAQTWDVDVGEEWVSSEHQSDGQQITSDPPREKPIAEHGSFMVDSSGHDEVTGLSEEAGLGSIQKAPELGQAAKSRSE